MSLEFGSVAAMVAARLNREQFFDKLAALDEAGLKKALWTLYWRGSAPTRERIETEIDPRVKDVRRVTPPSRPDPEVVLEDVRQFVMLARAGAYLAGDRRISSKERTRWRLTFKPLATDTMAALGGDQVESAAAAMETLIALACEMRDYDYFRSEDPVEAARFVVSDAAAVLWSAVLRERGFTGFAGRAAGQLLRWESSSGWTRWSTVWVGERERSLARVVAGMLPALDAWGLFADEYLSALDRVAGGGGGRSPGVAAAPI